MPELAEVEIVRRNLVAWTAGRDVTSLELLTGAKLDGDPEELVGRTVIDWERRGKYLIGLFSGRTAMLSHLGMTGKWVRDDDPKRRAIRMRLSLADGASIVYVDPRRLGRAWIAPTAEILDHERLRELGPDALDEPLSAVELQQRLGASRRALKRQLMDQAIIAGLGNISAVEIAWRAGVHPHVPARRVSPATWPRIASAIAAHIAHVLHAESGDEVVYLSEGGANPFMCYGRAGKPCRRCGTALAAGSLARRPSVWCPVCQPGEPGR